MYSTEARLCAMIGSLLVIAGCLMPVVTLPLGGSITYIAGDGKIVILIAFFAFLFATTNKLKPVFWLALAMLIVITYDVISIQVAIAQGKDTVNAEMAGNEFKPLTDILLSGLGLAWGWAALYLGSLLCVAAYIRK